MTDMEKHRQRQETYEVMALLSLPTAPPTAPLLPDTMATTMSRTYHVLLKNRAALVVQSHMRSWASHRVLAALRTAKTLSEKAAAAQVQQAALAAQADSKADSDLAASLAYLLSYGRLTHAAIVRGDMAKLRTRYGAATAVLVSAFRALLQCKLKPAALPTKSKRG